MRNKKPYISFVVVGRNDNYGYRFLERFQIFLDSLTYLCEKYRLDSELIVVEWNPPMNTKKLYDVLKIKRNRKYLDIRFLEVPNKIHNTLERSNKIPLFEYIGKNVGIRQARGEFILITNPDMIISDEIIREISDKKLDGNTLYRADRFDVPVDVPDNLNVQQIENFCEKSWFACWSVRWGRYFRGLAFVKNLRRFLMRAVAKLVPGYSYLKYHGGAPGDFMLISKNGWWEISGFFEDVKSFGIDDSYGCIASVASGNKFKIMRGKTYHQFHECHREGRITCSLREYREDVKNMLAGKRYSVKDNDSDWGLNKYKLKEKVF